MADSGYVRLINDRSRFLSKKNCIRTLRQVGKEETKGRLVSNVGNQRRIVSLNKDESRKNPNAKRTEAAGCGP